MAFASHADFRPPSSRLSVDPRPATCPDGFDALDDCILGAGIMSPASAHRRESFADSNAAMFSPQGSVWNEFPLSVPSNPFYDQDNNPFNRLDAAQAAAYGQQPSAWPLFDRSSGSCTPAVNSVSPTYDHVGPDFDSGRSSSRARVGANAPPAYGRLPLQNNLPPSSVFSPARAISIPAPLSPHNNKEWMTLAAQEAESRPLSKRMRPNAPPRNYSPFSRRDGIRKKNARFEIPAERSLINIDHLIAHSTNDDEIKELKQQKRLLRNRQAALDSRQRKKKHTEDLEEEKKLWTERLASLEDELNGMRLQVDAHMHEREEWHRARIHTAQMIEMLQWEKEELVRSHTLETGELRKKVSVLTEKLEAAAMSAGPGSPPCFTDLASDMNNFTMSPTDLDPFVWVDGFSKDSESVPARLQQIPHPHQQPPTTLVVSPGRRDHAPASTAGSDRDQHKPVASGLLLMLLLCGAFVASKSSTTGAPALPRMPDDVRAASATVLDSIFEDAGVAPSGAHAARRPHQSGRFDPGEPASSGWPRATLSGAEFASLSGAAAGGARSSLDALHAQLVAPSSEQRAEQLFGMSASQYRSLTSAEPTGRGCYGGGGDDADDGETELLPSSPKSAPATSRRRNLAEALAAMRDGARGSGETAAEVYTRSLLWERIPSEVVREFKRMVEESEASGCA